jgi:hypothetical protein
VYAEKEVSYSFTKSADLTPVKEVKDKGFADQVRMLLDHYGHAEQGGVDSEEKLRKLIENIQ